MPTRGRFVCHVHSLVHDGVVRLSLCGPHHENFGRNICHMFVPAYSESQYFVLFCCGIRVASMSSVDSIPPLSGVLTLLCQYQSFLIIEFVISISSQPVCSSSGGSNLVNIRKINSKYSQRCLFHPFPNCFCFLIRLRCIYFSKHFCPCFGL